MSVDQYMTMGIWGLAFAILIKGEVPPVAIFVGALILTFAFHLAPLGQSLKGFSNSDTLTVGALLMVAVRMYRTGAITFITEKLFGHPKSLPAAQARILLPVACSNASFNAPMGYQTNLMVYGPGGYKFTDFVKFGIPMTIVVGIITIIVAPLVWPF